MSHLFENALKYGDVVIETVSNVCKKHSINATLTECYFVVKQDIDNTGVLVVVVKFDPGNHVGEVKYSATFPTEPHESDISGVSSDLGSYLDMIITESKRELIMCQSEVDNKMIPLPVESFVSDQSIVYVFREIESGKAEVGLFTDTVILSRGYFNDLQDALARDRKRNNENESTKGTD